MKILLIDACYNQGSTGEIAFSITECLINSGYSAKLLYALGDKKTPKYGFRFAYIWEVYLHALLSRITGKFCEYAYFSTNKLLAEIDRFAPDIIHIHDPKPYYMNLHRVLIHIAERETKVVITLHSEFFYTGKCGYALECERYKDQCGKCSQLKKYPKTFFFDHTAEMIQRKSKDFSKIKDLIIVCPSKWLADRAKESFFKKRNIYVVHNGVDTDIFRIYENNNFRDKYGLQNRKIVISAAPNIMSERKGGRWIVQLADKMTDIVFIMVGANKKSVDKNIIKIPLVRNRIELAQMYSNADLFLLCSEKETFSMTCAEALCCGTPVLGFRAGAPETVFEKPYAEFVDYGDIKALEKKIVNFFKIGNRTRFSNECENYGWNQFSKMTMNQNYINLYEEVHGYNK